MVDTPDLPRILREAEEYTYGLYLEHVQFSNWKQEQVKETVPSDRHR